MQKKKSVATHFTEDFLAQLRRLMPNQNPGSENPLLELRSSLKSHQALQVSALIGRRVMLAGNYLYLTASTGVDFAIDMKEGIQQPKVYIFSELHELIAVIGLGQPEAGIVPCNWDGISLNNQPAPTGRYRVEAKGELAGNEVSIPILVRANVDSVSLDRQGEGVKLNLSGVGSVNIEQVC